MRKKGFLEIPNRLKQRISDLAADWQRLRENLVEQFIHCPHIVGIVDAVLAH
jgi:hypothetical protein